MTKKRRDTNLENAEIEAIVLKNRNLIEALKNLTRTVGVKDFVLLPEEEILSEHKGSGVHTDPDEPESGNQEETR